MLSAWALAHGALLGANDPNEKQWFQLFNGKDFSDWRVKITGHDLNDNFANIYRRDLKSSKGHPDTNCH